MSGYLYDEKGTNLSEAFFPERDLRPDGPRDVEKAQCGASLKEGAEVPRKVFVFADPFCPYCKQFWAEAQPWVKAGKVQLNTLLVAFLNPNSGRNASAILNAKDPVSARKAYELSGGKSCRNLKERRPGKPLRSCKITRRSWTVSARMPHRLFIT